MVNPPIDSAKPQFISALFTPSAIPLQCLAKNGIISSWIMNMPNI